jgi:hypothetical protein
MTQRPDEEDPSGRGDSKRYAQEKARDERTGRSAAAERIRRQTHWVDLQVRRAMERGEFDDLPGAGKPLDLPDKHDPDWWVKKLIEREQITGIAPAAISLRREDAELDGVLDREATEDGVRRTVEDFNRRIVEARRQLTGGPPVITPTRDPEAEVRAWRERREQRRAERRRTEDPDESRAAAPVVAPTPLSRRPTAGSPPASAPAPHARRPR